MDFSDIKIFGTVTKMMAMLPINLLTGGSIRRIPIRMAAAWDEEKQEILSRSNWIYEQLDTSPEQFLKKYPTFIGSMYAGQWAIYTCSMYVAALSDIARIYPEQKETSLTRMVRAIEMALSPALRRFDSDDWKEDPLDGVAGNKGHLTYLTTIGWMIGEYRLSGGNNDYDDIYHKVCDGINQRMLKSKDMNVVSFRNNIVFISDMVLACLVLQQHDKLFGIQYKETVSKWMQKAKEELIHKPTGLLVAEKKNRWSPRVRGSYTALTNYFLTRMDDKDFAKDQYERMKKVFLRDKPHTGIKEYQRQSEGFKFDPNAGPMLYGLSTSGTAIAIGTATYFEDWEFRNGMLQTAEMAQTTKSGNTCHYRLAEIAPVGEAFVLAMRTNVNR